MLRNPPTRGSSRTTYPRLCRGNQMRRLVLLLTILACLAVPAALAKGSFPETIPLPNGFAPEGDSRRQGRHLLRRLHSYRCGLRRQPAQGHRQRSSFRARQVTPRPGSSTTTAACGCRAPGPGRHSSTAPGRARSSVSSSSRRAPARRSSTTSSSRGRAAYFTDSNRPVIYKVSKSWGGSPGSRDPDHVDR